MTDGKLIHRLGRFVAVGLALVTASPATADLTAVYAGPRAGFVMTVEVDDNGDARGQVAGQPEYFITQSGETFIVRDGPSGQLVTRFKDLTTVMAERWKALPVKGVSALLPKIELVENGSLIVNGRNGKAYFIREENGRLSRQPAAVISDDPQLASLGRAMEQHFAISSTGMALALGEVPAFAVEMQNILSKGAPISFAGMELESVSTDRIDRRRFELPSSPETLQQVRARLSRPKGRSER